MSCSESSSVPDLVGALRALELDNFYTDRVSVDGLDVNIRSVDASQVGWVLKYLQPLSLGMPEPVRQKCSCCMLYSDDLVVEAIRYLCTPGVTTFIRNGKNKAELICSRISRDVTLCCNTKDGIFWLIDLEVNCTHIVYSSRTRQPSLEFARTVRNTVVAYLEGEGWVSYHAGAVDTDQGVLMIVGNSGAGKTSLILALLRCGARYIANERLLVRQESAGFKVLGYPMAIAVGIGTARQFRGLSQLVESPDQLLYPRSRFSKSRVARTPPEQQLLLDDKLQLLPEELSQYVGSIGAVRGGLVRSIVVPQVSREPISTTVLPLKQPAVLQVLTDNYMGLKSDNAHPVWVQRPRAVLDSTLERDAIDQLSNVDAVTMQYALSGVMDTTDYMQLILNDQPACKQNEEGAALVSDMEHRAGNTEPQQNGYDDAQP